MALSPDLVRPERTALVINECQEGVVGASTFLPQLREAALPALHNLGRLVEAGRAAGVQIVHCVVHPRADGKGANTNTRFAGLERRRRESGEAPAMDPDAFSAVVPEISVAPEDLVVRRIHGMSPMADTGVDSLLRNLSIASVVAGGVSLNLGVTNLVLDAMNRSYQVVVPTDASAGVPMSYCADLLEHTISMVARLTSTEELLGLWGA